MSTSLSPHPEVTILPSLPPSPSLLDEVFSHPRPWSVRLEDFDWQNSRRSSPGLAGSHAKGKGKETILDEVEEDDEDAQHSVSPHEAYPPTTDDAAETQRVEEVRTRPPIPSTLLDCSFYFFERYSHAHPEPLPSTFPQCADDPFFFLFLFGDEQTLKRWELAERQRRKSIRESVQYTSAPSLFSSVTRTASLVLSGRTSIGTSVGPGNTRTLKSVDVAREGYNVPLDDIDRTRSPRDVAVDSASASLLERNSSLDASTGTRTSENPFVHPSERAHTPTLLGLVTPTPMSMSPSSNPPSPSPFGGQLQQGDLAMRVSAESKTHASTRSSASRTSFHPPPRPLGLPAPPEDISHTTPLQPTPQPVLRPPRREDPEERQEVRWWHDWLCGCGEGPDRGGDNQVRGPATTSRFPSPDPHSWLHRQVVRIRLNSLVALGASHSFHFSIYYPSFLHTIVMEPSIILIGFFDARLVIPSIFSTLHTLLTVYSLLLFQPITTDIII